MNRAENGDVKRTFDGYGDLMGYSADGNTMNVSLSVSITWRRQRQTGVTTTGIPFLEKSATKQFQPNENCNGRNVDGNTSTMRPASVNHRYINIRLVSMIRWKCHVRGR